MDDLISRQDAIDAVEGLKETADIIWGKTEYCRGVKDALEGFSNSLKSVPSVPCWIPVTESLPKAERKHYWICTDTGYQCECRWTNNRFGLGESDKWGWSIFDVPQYSHVVAWMPLPEPYKGGGEE